MTTQTMPKPLGISSPAIASTLKSIPFVLKTSNEKKLAEVRRFGLQVQAELGEDLPEVDGTPEEVVMYKALAAGENVLVEDTSLDVEGFSAGVNIRWMLDKLKQDLKGSSASPMAIWRVMLAVHHAGVLYVAEAQVRGTMVGDARGAGFAFDQHFIPSGSTLTLGELDAIGLKDSVSARKAAVLRLLNGNCKTYLVADIPAWAGAYQTE